MPVSRCIPWWFGVLVIALVMPGCQRPAPEQHLRESIVALQDALEARDADAVDEWLAEDFVGPDGLDRDGARRLAQLMFLRHRDVGISLGPMELELQERHATVGFTALLTGGPDGLLPDRGQIFEVQTGWRIEEGDWRLTSARWSAATQ